MPPFDCTPAMNITPATDCNSSNGGGTGSPTDPTVNGCCSPSITTTTLCNTDCAPVTLVIRSGCTECSATPDNPQVIGWIDDTATFNPGTPPAGLVPCDTCTDTASPGPHEDCDPIPRCAGFTGLSGEETWTAPTGVEAVNINVVCGPITVIPCAGDDAVVINECGAVAWSAPGTPCQPGELCPGFEVIVPEGSSAYISWVGVGCNEGEESP